MYPINASLRAFKGLGNLSVPPQRCSAQEKEEVLTSRLRLARRQRDWSKLTLCLKGHAETGGSTSTLRIWGFCFTATARKTVSS